MMCGVTRTEGMRRLRARRRTVDSLTCKIFASWRAVKNSSRSSMIDLRSSYSNYQFSAKHKTEVEVQKAEIRSQIRGASFDASGFAAFRAERLCLSGKL